MPYRHPDPQLLAEEKLAIYHRHNPSNESEHWAMVRQLLTESYTNEEEYELAVVHRYVSVDEFYALKDSNWEIRGIGPDIDPYVLGQLRVGCDLGESYEFFLKYDYARPEYTHGLINTIRNEQMKRHDRNEMALIDAREELSRILPMNNAKFIKHIYPIQQMARNYLFHTIGEEEAKQKALLFSFNRSQQLIERRDEAVATIATNYQNSYPIPFILK